MCMDTTTTFCYFANCLITLPTEPHSISEEQVDIEIVVDDLGNTSVKVILTKHEVSIEVYTACNSNM